MLPLFEEFCSIVKELNKKMNEKVQLSDEQSLRFENALGDDVAQQATHIYDSTNQCCIDDHCSSDDDIPSAYYFVYSQQDNNERSKEFRLRQTVKAIANIFEVKSAADVQNEIPSLATCENTPVMP